MRNITSIKRFLAMDSMLIEMLVDMRDTMVDESVLNTDTSKTGLYRRLHTVIWITANKTSIKTTTHESCPVVLNPLLLIYSLADCCSRMSRCYPMSSRI